MTYTLLLLQKARYFENLKAKFWNRTKANCPLSEDQEGISLDSLGGVFIAAVFGLLIAVVILIFEVIYHRQKKRKVIQAETAEVIQVKPMPDATNKIEPVRPAMRAKKNLANPSPPPTFEVATRGEPTLTTGITFGSEFKPRKSYGLHLRRQLNITNENDGTLPPYME